MKIYTIPVTWQEYGFMLIEAETIEQAKEIAIETAPLPFGEYIEDSIEVDNDIVNEMNGIYND